jgi:hypothetical protein
MEHIQSVSRKYIALINVLLISVPVGTALYWIFFNGLPDGFRADLPVSPKDDLQASYLVLAFVVTLIPMGVGIYGLLALRALFRLYEQGKIFTAQNVSCFRRLGYTLIAWVVATALFTPLISAVLSYSNALGERAIVAKFGIADFSTLIVSGVVLILASVMNRACELEADQALTI